MLDRSSKAPGLQGSSVECRGNEAPPHPRHSPLVPRPLDVRLLMSQGPSWQFICTGWPWWLVLPLAAAGVWLMLRLYRLEMAALSPKLRRSLLLLRGTALVLLVLFLMEPAYTRRSTEQVLPLVAVIVDQSGSMAVKDESMPPGEKLAEAIGLNLLPASYPAPRNKRRHNKRPRTKPSWTPPRQTRPSPEDWPLCPPFPDTSAPSNWPNRPSSPPCAPRRGSRSSPWIPAWRPSTWTTPPPSCPIARPTSRPAWQPWPAIGPRSMSEALCSCPTTARPSAPTRSRSFARSARAAPWWPASWSGTPASRPTPSWRKSRAAARSFWASKRR